MRLKINMFIRSWLALVPLLGSLMLSGCEPPLVLDGVEEERSQAVRRADDFQAMAYNGSTAVAAGARGVIVMSRDGGDSWSRTILEGKPFLMDIDVCPDDSFVILDYLGNIWLLESAAAEWQPRPIDSMETPQTVACDTEGRIWVAGGFSSILRSDDRGETWSENVMNRDLYYTSVQVFDANNAILTGEFGVVTRTTDGGDTWEMLEPIPDDFYPQAAWFQSPERGWATGLNGTVFYTNNAGASWQSQETGTNDPIHNIVADGHSLYAVGSNGLILKCAACVTNESEEAAWQVIEHDLPVRFYLRGAAVIGGKLWVAGAAGALHNIEVGGGQSE